MARSIPGAIWEFIRYEETSRLRGDLVLSFRTESLDQDGYRTLYEAFAHTFPRHGRYGGGGDEEDRWTVEAHVPHAGTPNELRARLTTWATAHRPPITDYQVRSRSLRGTV